MKRKKIAILQYPGVFEPNELGGYNVSFPAFPGCVTFGFTFEEAKVKAKEVLELWLEELASRGEVIPAAAQYPVVDKVWVAAPPRAKVRAPYAAA